MTAGGSAAAQAAALRAAARRGLWRRLLAWLGLNPAARRADRQAGAWGIGAAGEEATANLINPLQAEGWHIRHDLRLPGSRANLDHLLVSPCGTAVIVLDSKRWHCGMLTTLVRGRVHCGGQDRHAQVEAVAGYALRVGDALDLPYVTVLPLVVVHGSPVVGGQFDTPTRVLGAELLVPLLHRSARRRDPRKAEMVAARVDRVLRPYAAA